MTDEELVKLQRKVDRLWTARRVAFWVGLGSGVVGVVTLLFSLPVAAIALAVLFASLAVEMWVAKREKLLRHDLNWEKQWGSRHAR